MTKQKSKKLHKKILTHPQKNLITKLLLDGKGVRHVSKVLKEMYPNNHDLWVSVPTLQDYRMEHLKIEGEVLEDLKRERKHKAEEKEAGKEHTQVRNLSSYKQKLGEIVDFHIDIKRGLVEMDALIRARLEAVFNKIEDGEASIEREKLLHGYFDRYFTMIDKWAKYVEKLGEQRTETNINITVIQDQMSVLRQAVMDILQEMTPEMAARFLDRLKVRMDNLSYRKPVTSTLGGLKDSVSMLAEAEILSEDPLMEVVDAEH